MASSEKFLGKFFHEMASDEMASEKWPLTKWPLTKWPLTKWPLKNGLPTKWPLQKFHDFLLKKIFVKLEKNS